ncbi:MAG TPA: ROK family protein [Gemmataceae bacterium]|nr:ROK family protein [Gemmataceae bacterium]
MYLGIEIGGTKLQLGVGPDDGILRGLWRGTVDVAAGPEGIRRQIVAAVPELLAKAGIARGELRGVGVGFGGPVDDATHTVIKSHQIEGWDDFPLADWIVELLDLPAALGNDADVAGLAEALHGAGKGLSPIFYITIGSGIGGGFIINGEIYRGCGRGAAEIGHLQIDYHGYHQPLEQLASGWGIEEHVRNVLRWDHERGPSFKQYKGRRPISAQLIAEASEHGDAICRDALSVARDALATAIGHVIALLCPRRIVIGGGVSLMGEKLLFEPLRRLVAEQVFKPFAGLADIVPAALGEEVVVHGAIALARKQRD